MDNNQPTYRRYVPYLAVLAVCLLAARPFWAHPSLPAGTDAELHIYRLAELSRLVRDGVFYPRWAPNFYFGYGYPIFNYYAPLAYYAALLWELLPGIDAVGAVKIGFVGGITAGGMGTFGLVRRRWGTTAGLVAAAVYVLSPYIMYVDPHARGVLPELVALGLLPCALWGLDSVRVPGRGRFIVATLTVAAALLAHNLMAMVFGGLFVGWVAWTAVFDGRQWRPWAALGLGIGLTGFFWLPVGLERNAVNLSTLVGDEGSHFDFSQHFLSWGELSAPSLWLDWGATEPAYLLNFGVAQWALALLGVVVLVMAFFVSQNATAEPVEAEDENKKAAAFFILAGLTLTLLMLPVSEAIWVNVPLLPYIQFPWRLLGPAVAMWAVVAGVGAGWIAMWTNRPGVVAAVGVGTAVLSAWPLLYVAPWDPFGPTDAAAVAYQETRGRWLGTTSTADFVPATVDIIPQRQGPMVDALRQNRVPDRINYGGLPDGVTAVWEAVGGLHWRIHTTADDDFLLRLFQFDFPGWTAAVDGRPVETEVGRPEGFLVVPVPAGEHTVDVRFTTTPARVGGWTLTVAALVVLIGTAVWMPIPQKESSTAADNHAPARAWIAPLTIALVAVVGTAVLPDDPFHYESRGLTVEPAQTQMQADFGGQLWLLGADLSATTAQPGDTIDVTLYWKAQRPLEIDYQSFVHLLAADGFLQAQDDKLNPGDFPTRRWPTDKYVRDTYTLRLPEGLPPGTYTVAAGLWVQAEGWRLPVLVDGAQVDDNRPVGEIVVEP